MLTEGYITNRPRDDWSSHSSITAGECKDTADWPRVNGRNIGENKMLRNEDSSPVLSFKSVSPLFYYIIKVELLQSMSLRFYGLRIKIKTPCTPGVRLRSVFKWWPWQKKKKRVIFSFVVSVLFYNFSDGFEITAFHFFLIVWRG